MKSIPYRNFWENNDDIFNNAVAKTRAGTNLNISKLSVQHRESQLTDGQPVKSAENFMIWTPWNFLEDKKFWLKKIQKGKILSADTKSRQNFDWKNLAYKKIVWKKLANKKLVWKQNFCLITMKENVWFSNFRQYFIQFDFTKSLGQCTCN